MALSKKGRANREAESIIRPVFALLQGSRSWQQSRCGAWFRRSTAADLRDQIDLALGLELRQIGVLEDLAVDCHRHALFDLAAEAGEAAVELEVEADTFRRMVLELDRRFPGLGRQIDESMAVAIDGEIFQDAYLAPLKPDSEIYLIPKIGGG